MKKFLPKLKNFWYYHKYHLLIALAALALILYSFAPSAGHKADYHIGIVTDLLCPEERLAGIERRILAAAADINGDGEILISLHPFTVDFQNKDPNAGYNNYEKVAALDADLSGKVSRLYLLEDPAGFQQATDGLLAEPFAHFDEVFAMSVRNDAPEEYLRLFENLKLGTSA